jgi:hypothetical protein
MSDPEFDWEYRKALLREWLVSVPIRRWMNLWGRIPYGYGGQYLSRRDVADMVPPGWKALINRCIDEALRCHAVITQVKEKYGTLRVYYHENDDRMEEVVSLMEKYSAYMCENCGDHGTTVTLHGWASTLCDRCLGIQQEKESAYRGESRTSWEDVAHGERV